MNTRLIPWVKGVIAAVVSMLLYAVPLGFFLALSLLIIAMEEGGATLNAATVPLTQAIVLLSEGVGFHAGAIMVGIIPLGLTVLLIALIRVVTIKTSTDIRAGLTGLVTWVMINRVLLNGLAVVVNDATMLVIGKAALVYAIGFLLAAWSHIPLVRRMQTYLRDHVSQPVRHAIRVGVASAVIMFIALTVLSMATVIGWIIVQHHAMSTLFTELHMQTGSRVLMCIMGLAWLPNVCAWALSWVLGGDITIGQAATYTLWTSSTHELPSLPLFALFPSAVESAQLRTVLLAIPFVLGIAVGLFMMIARRGFHIRPFSERDDIRSLIIDFAYPAASFCIGAAIVSLTGTLLFTLSNGSLGTHRLAHVGVDIRQSSNVVAQPCMWGLFIAWGTMLVLTASIFAIRWLIQRRHEQQNHFSQANAREDQEEEKTTTATRAAHSSPRVVNSTSSRKEKQGDDNEPTVTTGFGIRIP